MLPFLSQFLREIWGPFRLLASHLVLICTGAFLGAILTWWYLPRLWGRLPHDQGKAFVKDSQRAKGKPTGAGVLFVGFFLLTSLLVLPFSYRMYSILGSLIFCMLTGYLDDRSAVPWGQLKKGLLDVVSAGWAAAALTCFAPTPIWVPFFKGAGEGGAYMLPGWIAFLLFTALLWYCINAVNCSDGVDGLAGSLALFALFALGVFLYGVVGNINFSTYLLIPHNAEGALFALIQFVGCGCLCGYLWYNASPSMVLMGDAGSRFLGLLIGVGCLATGNPFMLIVVAPILLLNGGGGMVKIVLFRCLRKLGFDVRQPLSNVPNPIHPENFATEQERERQIGLVKAFHKVRFPLHDQCRKNWNWSDSQVLVRFMLLQAIVGPVLIILFLKLR